MERKGRRKEQFRKLFSWAHGEKPWDCHRGAMESYLKKWTTILWGCLSTAPFYRDADKGG